MSILTLTTKHWKTPTTNDCWTWILVDGNVEMCRGSILKGKSCWKFKPSNFYPHYWDSLQFPQIPVDACPQEVYEVKWIEYSRLNSEELQTVSLAEAIAIFIGSIPEDAPLNIRHSRIAEIFGVTSIILQSGGTAGQCVVAIAFYLKTRMNAGDVWLENEFELADALTVLKELVEHHNQRNLLDSVANLSIHAARILVAFVLHQLRLRDCNEIDKCEQFVTNCKQRSKYFMVSEIQEIQSILLVVKGEQR